MLDLRHPGAAKMQRRKTGMVLIIVLVALVLLSLVGFTFSELMFSEYTAVNTVGRTVQARYLAESGVEAAQAFLLLNAQNRESAGGWYDNPGYFRAINVHNDTDPRFRGNFTLVAPLVENGEPTGGVRFGLDNESTRINLNTLLLADDLQSGAARKILLAVPQMTEAIADAILDWIDTDDEPREFGAELDYYAGLDPPYAPANGPLQSVEELLQVRGVTAQLLFGKDTLKNFGSSLSQNSQENDNLYTTSGASSLGTNSGDASTSGTTSSASSTSSLDSVLPDEAAIAGNAALLPLSGWSSLFTIYSAERNVTREGTSRIDVNQEDLTVLYGELSEALGEEWATFIVAYRQFGPYDPAAANNQQNGGQNSGGAAGGQTNPNGGQSGPASRGQAGAANGQGAGAAGGQGAAGQGSSAQIGSGASGSGTSGAGNSGGPTQSSGQGQSGAQSSGVAAVINDPNPEQGEAPGGRAIDKSIPAAFPLTSFLDLVGVRIQARFQNVTDPVILRAQFMNNPSAMRDYLPKLGDAITVNKAKTIPGRININQASRSVLLALPGVSTELVDSIIANRELQPRLDDLDRQHETWILAEGYLSLTQMKALLPFVTVGGDVFRVQSVGFYEEGGQGARVEAILDATASEPAIVFWRELSHLGRGFKSATLGGSSSGAAALSSP